MITYEDLLADSNKATELLNSNDSYHFTYIEFLKFFDSKAYLTKSDIFIGANFTYAWMPTINKTACEVSDDIEISINRMRGSEEADELSIEEVLVLSKVTNNSLVGVSKLLHFIAPNKYAIWDSRVARYLLSNENKEPSQYYLNNPKNFTNYMNLLCKLAQDDMQNDDYLKKLVSSILNYEVTTYRAIELIMFSLGKKGLANK
ncbi:hypothetical protein [Methylophaga sp. OBS3]|uniref:hypothetical protein n=1 Tax=Methylophaga sp. OBS3 TaxID=2991934 RepID=UPI0022558456|nr:hypothetical protein [Methylophaga sp. OBS3]MCX4190822.1 hypothetical protein [Methylophaga sp. OBS3]